jgi:predicted nucleotidyltransferase
MGNIFNSDFRDFLLALNNSKVEYLIIGGYAVILHGYSRTTGDLDIWVNCTTANYNRLKSAFAEFKMPLLGMSLEKFLDIKNYDVFTYGRSPVSIDIMTAAKGLLFAESFAQAKKMKVDDIEVYLVDYRDLITAKKASARLKDLDDINNLSKP